MGLFDFLFKSEQPKKISVRPSTPTPPPKRESINKPNTQQSGQRPVQHRTVHKSEEKKAPVKVTDNAKIVRGIELKEEPKDIQLTLYCSVRPARIFCHSILVDKLGDLTKFILSSLYDGHSIEEVMELTKMGNATVKEEIDYLIRGGLIDDDRASLTELGTQYGRLLERFEQLSEGIGVAFNTFANIFEPIEENGYYSDAEQGYILPNHFIPTLARNDNYANSLDIAKEQIEEDIPFSDEIKNSLYTTVRIEKSAPGYKRVFLRDFSRCYVSDREASIKIAIPYDRIQCRPRYAWIDPYRSVLLNLCDISREHSELLTDEAKLIIKTAAEEDDAEIITVDADTITGELTSVRNTVSEEQQEEAMIKLNRKELHLILQGDDYNGMYLEEVSREEHYKIQSFSYRRMEAQ